MSALDDVKILVTGGAGFLGSEVVRQLNDKNADITAFDNFSSGKKEYIKGLRNVKLIEGDICDDKLVTKALKDQEQVIHLAALPFIPDCYAQPGEFFRVNAIASVNLMWKSIRSETVRKFVYISSSEVYGTAKYVPIDEQHPTLPHSTYAVSKLSADRALFAMYKEHDFPTVIIRPFNTFGPNITQPYIIPEIALQLLSRKNGRIQLGNIEASRDFTYVTDIARGILMALQSKCAIGETINLGSGKSIKIRDLVFLMAKLVGKKVKIEQDKTRFRPYDVECLLCDNRKAKKILGWAPQVTMEEGLKKTINWIVNNPITFKGPFRGWYQSYYGGSGNVQK